MKYKYSELDRCEFKSVALSDGMKPHGEGSKNGMCITSTWEKSDCYENDRIDLLDFS